MQTATAGTSYVVADMVWRRRAISGQKIIDGEELYHDEYKKPYKTIMLKLNGKGKQM
jgi:hypothetical protein